MQDVNGRRLQDILMCKNSDKKCHMGQSSPGCVRMIRGGVGGIGDKTLIETKKHSHSIGCLVVSYILIIYLVFSKFTGVGRGWSGR